MKVLKSVRTAAFPASKRSVFDATGHNQSCRDICANRQFGQKTAGFIGVEPFLFQAA